MLSKSRRTMVLADSEISSASEMAVTLQTRLEKMIGGFCQKEGLVIKDSVKITEYDLTVPNVVSGRTSINLQFSCIYKNLAINEKIKAHLIASSLVGLRFLSLDKLVVLHLPRDFGENGYEELKNNEANDTTEYELTVNVVSPLSLGATQIVCIVSYIPQ